MRELKSVQGEIADRSRGAPIGLELQAEGYRGHESSPFRQRSQAFFSLPQSLAFEFFSDLTSELWRDFAFDDPDAILDFLTINAFFFRSGYIKKEMIRRLCRGALTAKQNKRVSMILRKTVLGGWQVSMPGWQRLARVLDDETVRSTAQDPLASGREDVAKKAAILVLTLQGQNRMISLLRGSHLSNPANWPEAIEWAKTRLQSPEPLDIISPR